ncbi:hypothetical protein HDV06_000764 [Boothiomyces sp. JEL0866]|nr:hypothetical protein HDV06_000764 [Boothiomyces sp. JEL0866]
MATVLNLASVTGEISIVATVGTLLVNAYVLYKIIRNDVGASNKLKTKLLIFQLLTIPHMTAYLIYYFFIQDVLWFHIGAFLSSILSLFKIVNEKITDKRIVYAQIALVVVFIVCSIGLVLQIIWSYSVPPNVTLANAQTFYLTYVVYNFKKVTAKISITKQLRKSILMCFILVLCDWVGIGLYTYNIVGQPVDSTFLLSACVANLHASIMVIVFIHLKDLLFLGRNEKTSSTTNMI